MCPMAAHLLQCQSNPYLPNPSAWTGYDIRSIFKRSLTGLNTEFSFSKSSCLTKAEEPSLPYYLPIAGGRIIGFIPFPRVLVPCKMQSVSSRIWTRVAVSISYDDNHYTTGTSSNVKVICLHLVIELLLLCFYIASLWLRRFLWGDRRREVLAPSSLCVWSQMPWRSLQITVLLCYCCFFFFCTPSKIRWIVKICGVVDRFLRKPFWFFVSILFSFGKGKKQKISCTD